MTGPASTADRLESALAALLLGRPYVVPDAEDEVAGLLDTARLLHERLPRLHPGFGFEERLARRLSEAASAGTMADGGRVSLALPMPTALLAASADGAAPVPPWRRRAVLAGGAIASGVSLAIPIVGAAVLAYRRARASGGTA